MFLRHPFLSLVTVAYLGLVGWITLGPTPYDAQTSSLIWRVLGYLQRHALTSWVTFNGVEFTANVLMFLPLGMFLVLLLGRGKWWSAIIIGVLVSCMIELAQYLWIPTRVADVRDIVSNGTGALVGVIIIELLTWPKARALRANRARLQRA